jgi:curved DNA-binding protein CbpA
MPTDHFATLGQPRRPWLDPEALKETFHRLTAAHHPDKSGDASRFAEINAAYAILRDPALRLRHLLELERPEPAAAPGALPESLTETFMRIATLRRNTDAFLKQQAAATTPLAQALLAAARYSLQHDVEQELACLEAVQAIALQALHEADAQWFSRPAELLDQLAAIQQELTYFSKWSAQLREILFHFQAAT